MIANGNIQGVQIKRNSPLDFLLKDYYSKEAVANALSSLLPFATKNRKKSVDMYLKYAYPPLEYSSRKERKKLANLFKNILKNGK